MRLSHSHLPKLHRIDMAGLRLELCQQAAKSFLREKLGKLDSLGTMGAFSLGQGEGNGAYTFGQDLSARHLTRWLEEDSKKAWKKIYQATNICNHPQGDSQSHDKAITPPGQSPFTILLTYSTCPKQACSGWKMALFGFLNGTALSQALR